MIILCEMVHDLPKLRVACRLTERVLEDDCVYAVCEAVKVLLVVSADLLSLGGRKTWEELDLESDRGEGSAS